MICYNIFGDKMIYLIYCSQQVMIQKQLEKLIKERLPLVNDFSLNYFDCEETPLQEIVESIRTLPFMVDKKLVVVKNSFFLSSDISKNQTKINPDFECIKNYLNNPVDFCDVIFTLEQGSIDEKTELAKLFRKKVEIIAIKDVEKKDWPTVVKKMFVKRETDISDDALEEFLSRCGTNLDSIINYVDILTTYSNKITKKDVEALVARPLEDNVFGIAEAILSKSPNVALKIYRDLVLTGEDPIRLLPIMANQLRFVYQVGYLSEKNFREHEIVSELKCSPYRVTLALRRINSIDYKEILNLLDSLALLDLQSKSGLIDKYQGFELFITRSI